MRKNNKHCLYEASDVKSDRLLFDIFHIVNDFFLWLEGVAAVHLRVAGQAGRYHQPVGKGQYNPPPNLTVDIAAVFSLPVESLFLFYDDGRSSEK